MAISAVTTRKKATCTIMLRLFLSSLIAALIGCANHTVQIEHTKTSRLSDYPSANFIQGMRGAENIYIDNHTGRIYVSDLSGTLYLIEGDSVSTMKITRQLKIGKSAWGITQGPDGYLYAAISTVDVADVAEQGGDIYQINQDLTTFQRISGRYKGVNGLAVDQSGDLYLATGNLSLLLPEGKLYRFPYDHEHKQYKQGEILIDNIGSANGLFYSSLDNKLLLSETFSKVSEIDKQHKTLNTIFETSKIVDGFDGLCTDKKGRFWLAEPINGLIKMYDPDRKALTRFQIDGMGVGSSCQVFTDGDEEYLFITEREYESKNDGRGVLIISMHALETNTTEH